MLARTDPAGSELAMEFAASVIAAIGPIATLTRPACRSLRCTSTSARNEPVSITSPASTHPQRSRPSAIVAWASSVLWPASWSKATAASPSPMTYLATGHARRTRTRHRAAVIISPHLRLASGIIERSGRWADNPHSSEPHTPSSILASRLISPTSDPHGERPAGRECTAGYGPRYRDGQAAEARTGPGADGRHIAAAGCRPC